MNSLAIRTVEVPPYPFAKDLALTVAVVICTRNRPAQLRKCLAAVAELNPPADQVLVIDNSSGSKETKLAAWEFAAKYVVEPTPGLSRARNRGLAECDSEIVAFLDDDAVPDECWLGRLLAPFENGDVAAATGRIITPDSHPGDLFEETPRLLNNRVPRWIEIASFGGLGMGSNMALRRSACSGWMVFDERLGRGAPFQIAEENYAFASLIARKHTAVYLPDAIVYHPSLRRFGIEQETRNSIAYFLLLLSEFPAQRLDLMRFALRRLMHKRLLWPRDSQEPGDIINSAWRVKIKAGCLALMLFLRTRRPRKA